MSVAWIPGYDFGQDEVVTRTSLYRWIAGAHPAGKLDKDDVGSVGTEFALVSTMSTTVTEGLLFFNTNTGMLYISGRNGHVPVLITRGAMFTRRIPRSNAAPNNIVSMYWRPQYGAVNVLQGTTVPGSAFSLGTIYDNFGMDRPSLVGVISVAAALLFRNALTWPSAEHNNADGFPTMNSCVSGFRHLYSFGGFHPIEATCRSTGHTIQSVPLHQGGPTRHGEGWEDYAALGACFFTDGGRRHGFFPPPAGHCQPGIAYPCFSATQVVVLSHCF